MDKLVAGKHSKAPGKISFSADYFSPVVNDGTLAGKSPFNFLTILSTSNTRYSIFPTRCQKILPFFLHISAQHPII